MTDATAAERPDTVTRRPLRVVAVVANGSAGALLSQPDAEAELTARFEAAGLEPRFVPRDAGTLPQRLLLARDMGADAVVVAGGDGTVACAAQHLLGTGVVLGILPFGTMNLLARDLGLPIGDTAAAIRVLAEGAPTAIDVGTVGGHVFLCASMLGLPARLARHREGGRGKNRLVAWARFAVAALRGVLHGRRLVLAVRDDSGERRIATQSVTVTVNPIGAPGHGFGRPRLDGGEFGVYVVGRLRLWDLPRLGLGLLRGRVTADPAVRVSRARRLVIGCAGRTLRVMNDGEVRLLRPPLRYKLLPRALRVIAPIQSATEPS